MVKKLTAKLLRYIFSQKKHQQQIIDSICQGYSTSIHWKAFEATLKHVWINNICILGVYQGRDIAYMTSILQNLGKTNFTIWGVDKFEDTACDDWPEKLQPLTWKEAGFGIPPNIETARRNLAELHLNSSVILHKGFAQDFLQQTEQLFDFIYIDISHDYETTMETIRLSINKLRDDGFLGGDDFSDQGTWGVKSAVQDSFSHFEVLYEYIWLARKTDYKSL